METAQIYDTDHHFQFFNRSERGTPSAEKSSHTGQRANNNYPLKTTLQTRYTSGLVAFARTLVNH